MSDTYLTLRQYLTEDEADGISSITDSVLELAEELVDAYVGFVERHVTETYRGKATGGTTTTLIDTSSNSPFTINDGYFERCVIQIIGGTNKGEVRFISAYDKDTQTITVSEAFSSAIDTTSIFKIYQLARFPRECDVEAIDENDTYYKDIPEPIRRAVIAQCEYIIEQGDDFFESGTDLISESIDDYSYRLAEGVAKSDLKKMIAPKARAILKTFRVKTGRFSDTPNVPR